MKIRDEFVLRRMGDSWMAVPIGAMAGKIHGLVSLNETAAAIWNLLREDRTEEEVVDRLLREYEGSREAMLESVRAFVAQLREQDMMEP